MNTVHERATPHVTVGVREGEEAADPLSLRTAFTPSGVMRLGYWVEKPEDRDMHGVLWRRGPQSLGQREDMLKLKCQACRRAARTAKGLVFLVSKKNGVPSTPRAGIHTDQPPVCRQHAHAAARNNPELAEHGYVPVLAQRAREYGVIGTPYILTDNGFEALETPTTPIPYGHPELRWVVALRLVRTLLSYSVIDLAPAQGGDR
ncbi:hypothetical protein [Streptomyces sp. A1499]|uniref:hypothetical protein n=1 Tax=Streptomyces sp. A1499 TaxID=2563104 RepID=UPI00109EA395|nr:hypothetical protein [Streptomyces sp. A1499]THC43143.1 hypothetical protein E7X58_35240 [Streptomyces sp. A1499]